MTGSAQAKTILAIWEACRSRFRTVVPKAALALAATTASAASASVAANGTD